MLMSGKLYDFTRSLEAVEDISIAIMLMEENALMIYNYINTRKEEERKL